MFDAQPHLTGERLELRPLRADDFAALAAAASDPAIWEQHPADRHREDVFRAFFDEHLASGGALVVLDRSTGEVIGTSRYRGYDAGRSEVEIGYTFLARAGSDLMLTTVLLTCAFVLVAGRRLSQVARSWADDATRTGVLATVAGARA